MVSSCLVGSTGLVGSYILSTLIHSPSIASIQVFTRKALDASSAKITPVQDTNSSVWPEHYPEATDVFFSALGTTARIAGGFDKQREIDYDLNMSLARAAVAKGVKVYVLISTAGADVNSRMPYTKMKGQLDEDVKNLGFNHTIILKPGLLVGSRQDSRPGEFAARRVADFLGSISGNRLKDSWAQDAEVVARAAVTAGLEAVNGKNLEKVRVLNQADIVRLGRTVWKDQNELK